MDEPGLLTDRLDKAFGGAADRDRGFREELLFAAKAKARCDVSSPKSVIRRANRISALVDCRRSIE